MTMKNAEMLQNISIEVEEKYGLRKDE